MNTVDPDLAAMIDGVFADHHKTSDRAAPGARVRHDAEFWQRLDSLGLVRLTGPEGSGGSGAGWSEAADCSVPRYTTVYAPRLPNTTCWRAG